MSSDEIYFDCPRCHSVMKQYGEAQHRCEACDLAADTDIVALVAERAYPMPRDYGALEHGVIYFVELEDEDDDG